MDGTLVNDPLKPMVNPANPPKDNVIVGRSLVKRFGRTVALDGLDTLCWAETVLGKVHSSSW
jgi:hypothetical protein